VILDSKYKISCNLTLPNNFRIRSILSFHQRDALQIAERVDNTSQILQKGVMWRGAPVCLSFIFTIDSVEAILASHQPLPLNAFEALEKIVSHMLGFNQAIDLFEATHRTHPELGSLIQKYTGLRVPVAATPFEALTGAIIGQQISIQAATHLRRRFIQAAGQRHTNGLWCYPNADQVVHALNEPSLRHLGFSQTKAHSLMVVSESVYTGTLPLDQWRESLPIEEIVNQLSHIRGIGLWTINYTLLRGFGYLDGSLHKDIGVRRGLQLLLASPEIIPEGDASNWLAQFSPWRALVAAYLWAFLEEVANTGSAN
jgi:DNA-3-methyladenine glycosylase II